MAKKLVNETTNAVIEELKKVIGPRIKRARETMGYSQGDLLEELLRHNLERTQGSMSQIENGKRLPSVEMLYVATRYLETSADYLLGLTESPMSPEDIEEDIAAAKGGGRIGKIMRQLPREKKRQVVEFADYLLSLAGDTDSASTSYEAAWHAAMNVIERKYGKEVTDDFLDALAANVPDLAVLVGPLPTKKKRID